MSEGLQQIKEVTVINCYIHFLNKLTVDLVNLQGAGKSLARPGRKKATATEDFGFHISYL